MKKCPSLDRNLLRSIVVLSWPTVVEQALHTGVMYIDTALVGHIGANASAAVGITSSSNWMIIGFFSAIGMGVISSIAKSMGAKNYDKVGNSLVQSIIISLIVGVVTAVIAVSISPFLPRLLGAEKKIEHDAFIYFFIISLATPLRACAMIIGAALRATGNTRKPMMITIVSVFIKLLLSIFLISGTKKIDLFGLNFVLPGMKLGVMGAGIASAAGFIINGLIMLRAVVKNRYFPKYNVNWKLNRGIISEYARIGLPVAAQKTVINLGHVVFTSLVSRLGTIALATHSIALTAEEAFYIPGFGMQIAAATLAGNAVGQQDAKKLRKTTFAISGVSASVMTILATLLFIFPSTVMSLFTTDPGVIRGGATILRIVAVSEPLFAMTIILEGVFNGVGDVKTPFIVLVSSMWGVRILWTLICVVVLGLGLQAVWVCMIADNIIRCILLFMVFTRRNWNEYLSGISTMRY